MKAVQIVNEKITVGEVTKPQIEGSEVLVKVASAGLNGADLLQLRGAYPPPPGYPPDIPGLEFAGTIVENGPRAVRFKSGCHVMGITAGGGQAEYVSVEESALVEIPQELPIELAGGFPETFYTAYDALYTQAKLQGGESLCIHGAAGGVGLAAVQLAVASGATVSATSRNPESFGELSKLGARCMTPTEFPNSGTYDVILELVGAINLHDNLTALAVDGRIAIIGVGAGAKTEIDLRLVMGKRATILGSTLRSRTVTEKATVATLVSKHVIPLVRSGRLKVISHEFFDFNKADQAYASFSRGGKLGKIILTF